MICANFSRCFIAAAPICGSWRNLKQRKIAWFRDPKKFWYKAVFGKGRR
jgi:hypothetical protein